MIEQKIRIRPRQSVTTEPAQSIYSPLSQVSINPNYASQYNPVSGLDPLAMLQQYRQTGMIGQVNQPGVMAPPVFVSPYEMTTLPTSAAPQSVSQSGSNK